MLDLTDRQLQVLTLAARGLNNREMGAELKLSPQTVRHQLTAVRHKLHARNTTHAVALAVAYNILTLEDLL